jgi:hypothetical protein
MGLGIFASVAAAVRLALTKSYTKTHDPMWDIVPIGLWGDVEEYLTIIAACVPCLRVLLENLLDKLGISTSGNHSKKSGTEYRTSSMTYGSSNTRVGVISVALDEHTEGKSTERILPGDNSTETCTMYGEAKELEAGRMSTHSISVVYSP